MAGELLDFAQVRPAVEEVGAEGVPETVRVLLPDHPGPHRGRAETIPDNSLPHGPEAPPPSMDP